MKKCILFGFCMLFMACGSVFAGDHTFGIGYHYFYTMDEIEDHLRDELGDAYHEDGSAINFSYRYKWNNHVGILAEVQTYPDGFLDAENTVSPRLLLVLGQSFYVGGGIGWNKVDWEEVTEDIHNDDEWTDSYFMLRAGMEFSIFTEHLFLDLNANYEFNNWNDIDEFDSDIMTFGVGLKFTL